MRIHRIISGRASKAFTLLEVVMSTLVASIMVGGSIYGYIQATKRGEYTGYSFAAFSQALQGLEQVRAAKWDPVQDPPVDEVVSSNFPPVTNILDIPISGTNIVYVTTYFTITTLSTNPALKSIRTDAVWSFMGKGPYTSSVATYRAPDQ